MTMMALTMTTMMTLTIMMTMMTMIMVMTMMMVMKTMMTIMAMMALMTFMCPDVHNDHGYHYYYDDKDKQLSCDNKLQSNII